MGSEKARLTRTQPSLEPVAIPLLSWLTWRSSTSCRWPCSLHTSEGARSIHMGSTARLHAACGQAVVLWKDSVQHSAPSLEA